MVQWMSLLSRMSMAAGRHDDMEMVSVFAVGWSCVPVLSCEIHLSYSLSNIVNMLPV